MPKRKIEQIDSDVEYGAAPVPKTKAARTTGKAPTASTSTSAAAPKATTSWKDIQLEGEGEDEVCVVRATWAIRNVNQALFLQDGVLV